MRTTVSASSGSALATCFMCMSITVPSQSRIRHHASLRKNHARTRRPRKGEIVSEIDIDRLPSESLEKQRNEATRLMRLLCDGLLERGFRLVEVAPAPDGIDKHQRRTGFLHLRALLQHVKEYPVGAEEEVARKPLQHRERMAIIRDDVGIGSVTDEFVAWRRHA